MRHLLRPSDAPNDGARRLCEALRGKTFSQLAKKLACDPSGSGVRHWAVGDWRPDRRMRERIEAALGIPADAWDEPNAEDPATRRRRPTEPPPTLAREA